MVKKIEKIFLLLMLASGKCGLSAFEPRVLEIYNREQSKQRAASLESFAQSANALAKYVNVIKSGGKNFVQSALDAVKKFPKSLPSYPLGMASSAHDELTEGRIKKNLKILKETLNKIERNGITENIKATLADVFATLTTEAEDAQAGARFIEGILDSTHSEVGETSRPITAQTSLLGVFR